MRRTPLVALVGVPAGAQDHFELRELQSDGGVLLIHHLLELVTRYKTSPIIDVHLLGVKNLALLAIYFSPLKKALMRAARAFK